LTDIAATAPRVNRVAAFLVLAVFLLAIYAYLFAQFVPSDLAVDLGVAAALVCGVGGGLFSWRTSVKSDDGKPSRRWWRTLVVTPVFALMGFAAVATGLSSFYTLSMGTPATRDATVSGWHSGRRSCSGPTIEGASLLGTHICYSHQLPRGTHIVLRGLQSALGLQVFAVEMPAR
jgi:hypothetical protein